MKNNLLRWAWSPASRIAMGLVSLMLSLVLLADFFTGYLPNRMEEARKRNAEVAYLLGTQVVSALRADSEAPLSGLLAAARQRSPQLTSAVVRTREGDTVAQIGNHAAEWTLAPAAQSTLRNIRMPISANEREWGEIQLTFASPLPTTAIGWLKDPLVRWLAFLAAMGLLAFALYLRRVLRHLDPNAAVPERVRTAFDTLTEGVLVLDDSGRIMLANQAFCLLHGEDAQALTGIKAEALPWLTAALSAGPEGAPWDLAVRQKQPRLGIALQLDAPGFPRRDLVLNCSPIADGAGRVRGCLASFSDVTELHERTERLRVTLDDLHASQEELEKKNHELMLLATRDALTGCLNRRALMEESERALNAARADGSSLCCIMCDVDHFKQINDRFGHGGGDEVLKAVGKAMARGVRLGDLLGRYGGEEFCVVLPATSLEQTLEVAERLRADIQATVGDALRLPTGRHEVTMSFGVSQLKPEVADLAALIDLADQALYYSKKNGRNRTTSWASMPKAEA